MYRPVDNFPRYIRQETLEQRSDCTTVHLIKHELRSS